MTLKLVNSEKDITAKTDSGRDEVRFVFDGGRLAIDLTDFCALVEYVLTSTDLMAVDPRLELLRKIAELNVVEGYNPGGKRLG